jgi:hypothetical protein
MKSLVFKYWGWIQIMLRRQLYPLSVINDFLIMDPSLEEGVPSGILNFVFISSPGNGVTQIGNPLQLLYTFFSSHEIKTSVSVLIYAVCVIILKASLRLTMLWMLKYSNRVGITLRYIYIYLKLAALCVFLSVRIHIVYCVEESIELSFNASQIEPKMIAELDTSACAKNSPWAEQQGFDSQRQQDCSLSTALKPAIVSIQPPT